MRSCMITDSQPVYAPRLRQVPETRMCASRQAHGLAPSARRAGFRALDALDEARPGRLVHGLAASRRIVADQQHAAFDGAAEVELVHASGTPGRVGDEPQDREPAALLFGDLQ